MNIQHHSVDCCSV